MEEVYLKKLFAAEVLRNPEKPFEAGLAVFGEETGLALRAACEWVKDPVVIDEISKLKEEGFDNFEKEDLRDRLVKNLMTIVESKQCADDRIKAAKVIGELKGLIEKPQMNINNNVVTTNKVMIVKDHGGDDDWSERLRKQQKALTDDSACRH